MKKILNSLPFKLLLGVAVGIVLGLVANEAVMNVVVTIKQVLGQIITFCVPLIVIGFIAPSITKLGHNASRMLGIALIIAYVSSVGAALMSTAAGYALIPHLSIVSQVDGLRELPEVMFQLEIPAIMNVMSALALSLMVGLAITWTKSKMMESLLDEVQNIVLAIVTKIIIPILPFFIASTFCGLAYEGTITKQFPVFIKVIIIVMIGHYIWMALLYGVAGAYSGKNPIEVVKHYGPAYITAVGTMSSAATLAVALRCAKKSIGTAQGHGQFRYPAVCQHPSVRLGADRGFLRHDSLADSVRQDSVCRNHDPVLRAARHLRHRRTRRAGRYGYGFARSDHRHPAV